MSDIESQEVEPVRGRVEAANYRKPEEMELKGFANNPLIQALPAPWDWEIKIHEAKDGAPQPEGGGNGMPEVEIPQIMHELSGDVEIDREAMKITPASIRIIQLTDFRVEFFQLLRRHQDLEQALSNAIRFGYKGRNPMEPRHRRDLRDKLDAFKRRVPRTFSAANLGFALLGSPGLGKTRSLERILQLYPQVVLHPPGKFDTQVVWLFLTCVHDKSTRALCLHFFRELDEILGNTNYFEKYFGATEGELMAAMATVAAQIYLGVLVVDEIQFLSGAKSGGKEDLMKFFVQLQNTLGIPIVVVGTHRATDIVTGTPHQARRGVGLGGQIWKPLAEHDPEWIEFLESMWQNQFLKKYTELTDGLAKRIYWETQGIPDYAVGLFYFAQLNAINDGTEIITEASLTLAAEERQIFNRPYVNALRSKNEDLVEVLADIQARDYEQGRKFFESRLKLPSTLAKSGTTKSETRSATNPKQTDNRPAVAAGTGITSFHPQGPGAKPPETVPIPSPKRGGKKKHEYPDGTIMAICQKAAAEKNIAPYQALTDANLICNAAELLQALSAAA